MEIHTGLPARLPNLGRRRTRSPVPPSKCQKSTKDPISITQGRSKWSHDANPEPGAGDIPCGPEANLHRCRKSSAWDAHEILLRTNFDGVFSMTRQCSELGVDML